MAQLNHRTELQQYIPRDGPLHVVQASGQARPRTPCPSSLEQGPSSPAETDLSYFHNYMGMNPSQKLTDQRVPCRNALRLSGVFGPTARGGQPASFGITPRGPSRSKAQLAGSDKT
eukprot:scaffold665927_cov47-Prasinocladus_malaysianus.AAC.1